MYLPESERKSATGELNWLTTIPESIALTITPRVYPHRAFHTLSDKQGYIKLYTLQF